MKIYNVWTIVEVEDTDKDSFSDLKDEQVCVGHFKTLEEATGCQRELQKESDSVDSGWYGNLVNCWSGLPRRGK